MQRFRYKPCYNLHLHLALVRFRSRWCRHRSILPRTLHRKVQTLQTYMQLCRELESCSRLEWSRFEIQEHDFRQRQCSILHESNLGWRWRLILLLMLAMAHFPRSHRGPRLRVCLAHHRFVMSCHYRPCYMLTLLLVHLHWKGHFHNLFRC
jgi:hypothetical protein